MVLDNFKWKTTDTDGVTETVNVKSAGKEFKLAKLSGGTITSDFEGMQITVKKTGKDGSNFNIKSSADNLGEDDVYINKNTGAITFGKELEADSNFESLINISKRNLIC